MSEELDDNINDLLPKNEYEIVEKSMEDILKEIDFKSEEEELLCQSIITNIEKLTAKSLRELKAVSIPYIGCVRVNRVRKELSNKKLLLKTIRKRLSKEEYKQYMRDTVTEMKIKQEKEDKHRIFLTKLIRNNKEKYETLYKKHGRAYAELYIKSIEWMEIVPFDEEFEERYRELNDIVVDLKQEERLIKDNIADYIKHQPRYSFKEKSK